MKKVWIGMIGLAFSGLVWGNVTRAFEPEPAKTMALPVIEKPVVPEVKPEVKPAAQVTVTAKWEVPDVLREVSGIAYLSPNRFACIQDEQGTIFIYNTATAKIEREIDFAGPGDYEGIAMAGNTAFVVRSDGQIYQVSALDKAMPEVTEFPTSLNEDNNIEGLGYDAQHNRLLLSVKDFDATSHSYKGIYAFNLKTKKLAQAPVYKLDLADPLFGGDDDKIRPSEVQVHPLTGKIFLTDAKNARLLILDSEGKLENHLRIASPEFYKPEGLAFSPSGELYISNEGKKSKGNILQVSLAGL